MTQVKEEVAKSSQSRSEAERIFAKQPPLSREQAEKQLAERGWTKGPDGRMIFEPKA